MIKLSAKAEVEYCCVLTDEDEQKVLQYAEENAVSVDEAVQILWKYDSGINIYAGEVTDSDCNTNEIFDVEFED